MSRWLNRYSNCPPLEGGLQSAKREAGGVVSLGYSPPNRPTRSSTPPQGGNEVEDRRRALKLLTFLCALLLPFTAPAKPLVADLSQYRIEIDSGFTGTRLLLFGARNDSGDIVVVVRGPERQFTVRRKERVAGIWVNGDEQRFHDVPTYYAVAASRPLEDIHPAPLFAPLRIGLEQAVGKGEGHPNENFAPALIQNLQAKRLYSEASRKVSFMGESLFKLVIYFPDNIPRGDYSADVYLFSDGQLQSMQSIPLHIEKTGFDAFISDFAHDHSVMYGLFAVLLAVGMGWGASSLMHRV